MNECAQNLGLVLICGVAPAVLIPVVSLLTPARGIADIHAGWLGLVVSLAITGSVTNVVKGALPPSRISLYSMVLCNPVVVGRPRPDLISRCQPSPGSANSPVFGLVTDAICTNTIEKVMNDGFRSFPSGHSSCGFSRSLRNLYSCIIQCPLPVSPSLRSSLLANFIYGTRLGLASRHG